MLWAEELTTPTSSAVYVNTDEVERFSRLFPGSNNLQPNENQQMLLKNYSNEKLVYHINYCVEAGILKRADLGRPEMIIIEDLTPSGHEFLGNIRDDSNFSLIKNTVQEAGIETLTAFIAIASTVAGNLITKIITG